MFSASRAFQRFTLKQRIKELEKAISRWPDSPKLVDREIELRQSKEELLSLDQAE